MNEASDSRRKVYRPTEFPAYDDPEPYTSQSLPADTDVDELRHTVTAGLASLNVDFEERPLQAKWKCSFTGEDDTVVVFDVRIWRRRSVLMLESQRRAGDAASFVRIHREILRLVRKANPPSDSTSGPEDLVATTPLAMPPATEHTWSENSDLGGGR